ncbi:TIGR01457 family HAD-type hydrolase [Paenibacillus physcomitrellae]|uniref:Acid sugar phosphatase n=1 Tax=Paenibacillus physcomitrellae TaxID=1619311 RepID=A0ABQ1FQJ5_9BACL|nr:TIGR01457 family HAD-type hydrolase [Paenibacillus physcomitrellae]GGA24943.1 haloacid dehalogenase [Paenibacillus physcomitrellae]
MAFRWKGFLIDLDGTMYHGSQMVPGADQWIAELNKRQIPFLFVTNNSSRTPADVAASLRQMGIQADAGQVCTSAVGAALYLADREPGARVAVVGEAGLISALEEAGLVITEERPDYVVQGIDRSFNYETLRKAVEWIRGGAAYILTNPDLLLPGQGGLAPGAGTLSAAIQAATGVKPVTIGKPESILMLQAIERLGLTAAETAVIGDNMLTDISAGSRSGCGTILTLTGVTTKDNLEHYKELTGITPDQIFDNLYDLITALDGKER